MTDALLYGLAACGLIGLGLYGLIANPAPLRKILAFNIMGGGVFLLAGAIARRGAGAGFGGDPVPQGAADYRHRRGIFGDRAGGSAGAAAQCGCWRYVAG
jgi:multisubunit Na+/H+ antiporter MnhC subunit